MQIHWPFSHPAHRTAVGAVTPTYDTNGNLTSDGTYTLGYDAENRLVSASGAGSIATYTFDAQGSRKTRTVNGTTTVSVTDVQNREVLEYNGATGALLRWYAYGLGPNDVLGQMNIPANTRTTPIPDLLGSIVGFMDAGTGTLTKFAYQPYGANANPATPFGYTGQRVDQESGLYYYRARHYSTKLGRFLQPDPIGYDGGINIYGYAGNDPLNLIDPAGLSALQAVQQAALQAVAQASAARLLVASAGTSQVAALTVGARPAFSVEPLNLSPISPGAGDEDDVEARRNVYTPCLLAGAGGFPCGPETGGGGGGGGRGSAAPKPTPGGGGSKVEDLVRNSAPGRSTKGPSNLFERLGGFADAQRDFNSLGPTNVRPAANNPNAQIGILPDGRTVTVRPNSSDGRPTLEIYDRSSGRSIKFRYGSP